MTDTFAVSRPISVEKDGAACVIGALHARVEPGRMGSMSVEIYDEGAWNAHAQAVAGQMSLFREAAVAFAQAHGGVLL